VTENNFNLNDKTLSEMISEDLKLDGIMKVDIANKLSTHLITKLNGNLKETKCSELKAIATSEKPITPTMAYVYHGNGDDDLKAFLRRTEALDRMKFAPYASTNFI